VWSLTQAAGKMVLFMALAEGINRIASGKSADVKEADFLASIQGAGARDAGAGRELSEEERDALEKINRRDEFLKEHGTAIGEGVTHGKGAFFWNTTDQKEFDKLNSSAQGAIDKANLTKELNLFSQRFSEYNAKLGDHQKTVGNTNIPDLGTKNKSKGETLAPADATYGENKLELKRYTKNLFNTLDKNKAEYQEALEELQTFIALFGENNVEAIRRRQGLEQGRILQIQQEQKAIAEQKKQLMDIAGDIIDKYPEMKPVVSGSLPTESGVDLDNVKPAVKSAAGALIQEISSQLGASPVITSGYRAGDPGGHGRGDKVDVAWDNLEWGSDDFNRAVQMAERAGFSVYTVPHGTGAHLDLNGSGIQGLTQLSNGISQEQWKGMSKDERLKYRLNNREESQSNSMLDQTLSQLDELEKKANEKTKELAKLQSDSIKQMFSGVFDEDKQRDRRIKAIDSSESIAKSKLDKKSIWSTINGNDVSLATEMKRYTEYIAEGEKLKKDAEELRKTEEKRAQAMVDAAKSAEELVEATRFLEAARRGDTRAIQANTDAQRENQVKQQQSLEKQTELSQSASQKVKTFWADSFLDIAQRGKDFKDIMKDLWFQIQKDAVYSMLGIKNQGTSVASTMLGKGKKNAGTVAPTSGKKGIGKAARGGILRTPTIAGEAGEEVAIPVENNTENSKKLLDYASNKLGYYPGATGDTYVPYFKNETLATQPVVNVQVAQQQNHIQELEKQTQVMSAMLNHMMSNQVQSGGGITVISTQMSDQQILEAINRNPSALSNILGRNKSTGWR
jgi:hypothetical protein